MSQVLFASQLYSPIKTIQDAAVSIHNGVIAYAGERSGVPAEKYKEMDFGQFRIAPGFVDIHTHGGFGIAFGEGNLRAGLAQYCQNAPASGVTGFLLSLTAPGAEAMVDLIQKYVPLLENPPKGARPLGFHLEGPYLNPEKKGAFHTSWLRTPLLADIEMMIQSGAGWVKQVTLAPELPNALDAARFLRWQGVTAALGHSNTDYETASQALSGDFTHVTHTFNAQSAFSHRQPGVIGAVLTSREVTAEIIADGHHSHPAAIKLLVNALGKERVVLITDAISGAGLPDGKYHLMDQDVTVQAGKATLNDGTIAGSTAQLNNCVRNMTVFSGISLRAAVRMATINPAKAVGLATTNGLIEPGRKADLVVLDANAQIQATYIGGEMVYSANEGIQ